MMSASSSFQIENLSPQDFFQQHEPQRLIDVRSHIEYALFHAPDTLNLSLPRLLIGRVPALSRWILPQWFRELPKDQPIAVICLTAHRSPIAARALADLGFSQIFNITGGMLAWQKAGLPTQKGNSQKNCSL